MLEAYETIGQAPDFWNVGFRNKIQKADFNVDPIYTLTSEEFKVGEEFLRFQTLPPKDAPIKIILGPGTSKSIDLLNYWKRINGLIKWERKHPETEIVMVSGKRPTASRATAAEMVEGFSEAAIMGEELIAEGMNPHKIQLEEEATHTGENITKSLDLLVREGALDTFIPINILIVTSSYCGRRTDAYMAREIEERRLKGKVNYFIAGADVQEDLDRERAIKQGKSVPPLTPEEEQLKLVTKLREMLRLDLYASQGQIPQLNTRPVLEEAKVA